MSRSRRVSRRFRRCGARTLRALGLSRSHCRRAYRTIQLEVATPELKVRVKQPAVEHRVRMKDFRRWLESRGKTPAEYSRKRKLPALAKEEGWEPRSGYFANSSTFFTSSSRPSNSHRCNDSGTLPLLHT